MSKRENIDKRRKSEHETPNNISCIEKYLTSNIRAELLQGILNHSKDIKISQQKYFNYRAALIGEVIYRSAQRSGVIHGMKKEEVANAKFHGENLKIIVYEHKNGKLKPAVVFLEKLASEAFIKFLKYILPKIETPFDLDGPFFISYNGNKISHQGIKQSLQRLTTLSGTHKSITSTQSRIAAATFIANNNPESTQIVADYMQHEASTANKYYRQMGGGSQLKNAFDVIGKMKN